MRSVRKDGRALIAMEFLEGATLRGGIAGRRMELETLRSQHRNGRRAGCCPCEGIVHRDIKPANIFVTASRSRQDPRLRARQGTDASPQRWPRRRRCRSCNLRSQREATDQPRRSTWHSWSTCRPEQVRAKTLDADEPSSSFGTVLCEVATGVLAFRGESSSLILRVRFSARIPSPPAGLQPRPSSKARRHHRQSAGERSASFVIRCAAEIRTDLQRLKRDTDTARVAAASSGSVPAAMVPGCPGCQFSHAHRQSRPPQAPVQGRPTSSLPLEPPPFQQHRHAPQLRAAW